LNRDDPTGQRPYDLGGGSRHTGLDSLGDVDALCRNSLCTEVDIYGARFASNGRREASCIYLRICWSTESAAQALAYWRLYMSHGEGNVFFELDTGYGWDGTRGGHTYADLVVTYPSFLYPTARGNFGMDNYVAVWEVKSLWLAGVSDPYKGFLNAREQADWYADAIWSNANMQSGASVKYAGVGFELFNWIGYFTWDGRTYVTWQSEPGVVVYAPFRQLYKEDKGPGETDLLSSLRDRRPVVDDYSGVDMKNGRLVPCEDPVL